MDDQLLIVHVHRRLNMNSIDIFEYELAKPGTPQPPPTSVSVPTSESTNPGTTPARREPTLNEEVNEALGQLSRFWGGFRKQVCVGRLF